jgi:cytochrome oxidase Cu insertion factor (SCO1/SenC/PrrC family)
MAAIRATRRTSRHNLRTVIIDADGKLVKTYTGNEWTPDQILADLKVVRTPVASRAAEFSTASGG